MGISCSETKTQQMEEETLALEKLSIINWLLPITKYLLEMPWQRKAPDEGCLKGEELTKPDLIFKLEFSWFFSTKQSPAVIKALNLGQETNLKFLNVKYLARLFWAEEYQILSVPWREWEREIKIGAFCPNFSQIPHEATGRIKWAELEMLYSNNNNNKFKK